MPEQPARFTSSPDVRVIWRDDVDPRGSAPLWASVQFVTTDRQPEWPSTYEQVVIEVGGAPRGTAAHGRQPWKGRLM